MFSAFSFGKVIKTILPGSVLVAGLLFLAESLSIGRSGSGQSLFLLLASKEWLTAATAVLVPVSLMLGFLLNTLVWLALNQRMRSAVNADLQTSPFPGIRDKLSEELWKKMSPYRPVLKAGETPAKTPSRESLEYFYLPLVSLDHLNYLWESYFSWYEFQINTAVAFVFATPGVICLLWVNNVTLFGSFVALALAMVVTVAPFFCGLRHSAKKNLAEYEKNLMLLITGALTFQQKSGGIERNNPHTY